MSGRGWLGSPRLVVGLRCCGASHELHWEAGTLTTCHDLDAELALATLGATPLPACVEIAHAWDQALANPRTTDRLADHLHGVGPGPHLDVIGPIDVAEWATRRRAEMAGVDSRSRSIRFRSLTPPALVERIAENEHAVFLRGLMLLLPPALLAALVVSALERDVHAVAALDVERLLAEAVVRSGVGAHVRCELEVAAASVDHHAVVVGARWLRDVWFRGAALIGDHACVSLHLDSSGTRGTATLVGDERHLLGWRPSLADVAVVADGRGAWWVAGV